MYDPVPDGADGTRRMHWALVVSETMNPKSTTGRRGARHSHHRSSKPPRRAERGDGVGRPHVRVTRGTRDAARPSERDRRRRLTSHGQIALAGAHPRNSSGSMKAVFRVPLAGDALGVGAVRAPTRSVALSTWDTNNCVSLLKSETPHSSPDRTTNSNYELQGPIRQRQKRLNEAQVAAMAARYEEGATVYDLAAQFGCNRQTVAERLTRAGTTLRLRSPNSHEVDEIVHLYGTGLSMVKIGFEIGYSASTVHNVLHQRGLPVHKTRGNHRFRTIRPILPPNSNS